MEIQRNILGLHGGISNKNNIIMFIFSQILLTVSALETLLPKSSTMLEKINCPDWYIFSQIFQLSSIFSDTNFILRAQKIPDVFYIVFTLDFYWCFCNIFWFWYERGMFLIVHFTKYLNIDMKPFLRLK